MKYSFFYEQFSYSCSVIISFSYSYSKGIYKNESKFEVFLGNYNSMPCPSGGMDCGSQLCFQTEDKILFDLVKDKLCNRLFKDNDSIKTNCLNGGFDNIGENQFILPLIFPSSREDYSPKKVVTRCLSLTVH